MSQLRPNKTRSFFWSTFSWLLSIETHFPISGCIMIAVGRKQLPVLYGMGLTLIILAVQCFCSLISGWEWMAHPLPKPPAPYIVQLDVDAGGNKTGWFKTNGFWFIDYDDELRAVCNHRQVGVSAYHSHYTKWFFFFVTRDSSYRSRLVTSKCAILGFLTNQLFQAESWFATKKETC